MDNSETKGDIKNLQEVKSAQSGSINLKILFASKSEDKNISIGNQTSEITICWTIVGRAYFKCGKRDLKNKVLHSEANSNLQNWIGLRPGTQLIKTELIKGFKATDLN